LSAQDGSALAAGTALDDEGEGDAFRVKAGLVCGEPPLAFLIPIDFAFATPPLSDLSVCTAFGFLGVSSESDETTINTSWRRCELIVLEVDLALTNTPHLPAYDCDQTST
jgi:hypothetical protein